MEASLSLRPKGTPALRYDLRKALHTRRIAELEAVLAEVEEALQNGVSGTSALYAIEVEHGQQALEMERRFRAHRRFLDAQRSRNPELMAQALEEGRKYGLGEAELEAIEETRKRNVALDFALGLAREHRGEKESETVPTAAEESPQVGEEGPYTNGSPKGEVPEETALEKLRSAYQAALDVGVEEAELAPVQACIHWEEQRGEVRALLAESLRTREEWMLREALAEAARQELPDWELLEVEVALAEVERRRLAQAQLKDALLKKSFDAREQIAFLRESIDEAKSAGVFVADIERAKWFLEREEVCLRARNVVDAAIATCRCEDLQQARLQALEVGLSLEEVQHLDSLIQDSHIPAARQQIAEAIRSRDPAQLRSAIQRGVEVGISDVGLADARHTLYEEERKIDVKLKLVSLVGEPPTLPGPPCLPEGCSIHELQATIRLAEGLGVLPSELEWSCAIADAEVLRTKARNTLAEAEAEGEEVLVFFALDDGDGSSSATDGDVASSAASRCGESRGGESRRGASKSLQHRSKARIERCEQLAQRLEAAVSLGEEAVLPEHELGRARSQLTKIDHLLKATHLAEVLKKVKKLGPNALPQLRAAIEECKIAGARQEIVEIAITTLAIEDRKIAARAQLASTLASGDIGPLEAAVAEGEAAGLSYSELRPGREWLSSQKRKADCRQQLEALVQLALGPPILDPAERPRTWERLKFVLKESQSAGLPAVELAYPHDVLAVLDEKVVAARDLALAVQSDTIPELQLALQVAEEVQLEPSEIEPPKARLAELELAAARAALTTCLHAEASSPSSPSSPSQAFDAAGPTPMTETAGLTSRTVVTLRDAVRYGEVAKIPEEDDLLLEGRLALAEEQLRAALASRAVHELETAEAYAELHLPTSELLPEVKRMLKIERKREKARQGLRKLVEMKDPLPELPDLQNAVREAYEARLEDWELNAARGVLSELRSKLA